MGERIEVEVEGGERPARPPGGGGGLLGGLFMLPGLGFIGLGIAIVVWPRLLVYMVAAVFVLIGLGLLLAARKIGRARKRIAGFKAQLSGSGWGPPPSPDA